MARTKKKETHGATAAAASAGRARRAEAAPGKAKSKSLTEVALDQLRDRILEMDIEPGVRLEEALLVKEFGFGRTPAREALSRLAAEGFVTIIPNRGGAFVRSLDFREVGEIVAAYELAEGLLGLLCRFEDPNLVEDLEEIQTRYRREVDALNYLAITEINEEFHLRMYQSIRNSFIESFAVNIHRHARRLIVLIHKLESADLRRHREQFEINVQQHETIIGALKARNRQRFAAEIAEHARYTHKRLANIIMGMPFDINPAELNLSIEA